MAAEELSTLFKPEGQQVDMTDYLSSSSTTQEPEHIIQETTFSEPLPKENLENSLRFKEVTTSIGRLRQKPQDRIRKRLEEHQTTLF